MGAHQRTAYHHGNLRAELIAAALELLRREGLAGLTLRATARAAGVSQAAPYKHFSDKNDLLAAVTATGFASLQRRCTQALGAAADARGGLRELGKAYVLFALDEPAMFRLMFGADAVPRDTEQPPAGPGVEVYDLLRQAVAAVLGDAGASDAAVEAGCAAAWSLVHGLAMLLLDRRIGVPAAGPAALIDGVTELFVAGLGAPGDGSASQ